MSSTLWMVIVSLVSWLALLPADGGAFVPEFTAGMAGPLLVSVINWAVVSRTFRATPERVQALMIHAFAAKLLFFAVYVIVMIRLLGLRPAPFVLSFTGYFVVLYAIQAFLMRRLFLTDTRSAA
jgi:uncharacterized membrane protein